MTELLTPDEMAECDRLTMAGGVAGIALMEKAGRAVADAVARPSARGPGARRRGPGNNGGDGFIAARVLAERGYQVRVMLLGEAGALRGDAAEAARLWRRSIEPAAPDAIAGAGVIVDALFGAGLNRVVEGRARELIEAMNACGVPIVAVDLPSGSMARAAPVDGRRRHRAREHHVSFAASRVTCCCPAGCTPVMWRVADIGIADSVLEQVRPRTFANAPALWGRAFPIPRLDGHKYSRGHAVVVSGDLAFTGAARLARAARCGQGLGLSPWRARRGAPGQRSGEPRRDGAPGRWRRGACGSARRPPPSTPSCWVPASASARAHAPWSRWRYAVTARWCSTPTR